MFTEGSAGILFYTSNTTDGFMSSQGTGMHTECVVESILPFHSSVLIAKSVAVVDLGIPTRDNARSPHPLPGTIFPCISIPHAQSLSSLGMQATLC